MSCRNLDLAIFWFYYWPRNLNEGIEMINAIYQRKRIIMIWWNSSLFQNDISIPCYRNTTIENNNKELIKKNRNNTTVCKYSFYAKKNEIVLICLLFSFGEVDVNLSCCQKLYIFSVFIDLGTIEFFSAG